MRIHIDADPGVPPFEQLRAQIAAQVAAGDLPAGSRLPTVRALAAELDLAPGTVARAYKELEADGVVVTEGRRGTSVASRAAAVGPEHDPLRAYVEGARRAGLTLPEALARVEGAWRR